MPPSRANVSLPRNAPPDWTATVTRATEINENSLTMRRLRFGNRPFMGENAGWPRRDREMVELGNLAGARGAQWIARPPHEELQRKVRPLLPSDDPFYQPPSGYQHAEPGTVLRSREVELAFLGLIPQSATAVQLLYRTMDMNGEPEATVTTVIVPAGLAPGQAAPLLSYQCAIDAMTCRCFPSYALRRRAKALGSLSQLEFLLINAAVAEGWMSLYRRHGRFATQSPY